MILLTGNVTTERLQNGTVIESQVVSRTNDAGQVEIWQSQRQSTAEGGWIVYADKLVRVEE